MRVKISARMHERAFVDVHVWVDDERGCRRVPFGSVRLTEFAGDMCSELRGFLRGLFWFRPESAPMFDYRNLQDMITRAIAAGGETVWAVLFEE